MRAVASPTINFGPFTVPVKAYLTASAEEISFHLLTPSGHRVKQSLNNSQTGEAVNRDELLSGYEVEKDDFVSFTSEELALVKGEKTDLIGVLGSLRSPDLSPLKVERALYLTPDKSDKVYRLLHAALLASDLSLLGKWHDRGKDHAVVIAPYKDLLVLYQLYYSVELREIRANFSPASEPTPREVGLARQIIERAGVESGAVNALFDEYAVRMRNAIVAKHSGKVLSERNLNKTTDIADAMEKMLRKKGGVR
jgi:DNA end-binding protein Ku